MPLNIAVSFTFPSALEMSPSWGFLETQRDGQRRSGVELTGYLDVLLHFALECTISGAGTDEGGARFQPLCALGLKPQITYLRKSKSMAEDLSWRGAQSPATPFSKEKRRKKV